MFGWSHNEDRHDKTEVFVTDKVNTMSAAELGLETRRSVNCLIQIGSREIATGMLNHSEESQWCSWVMLLSLGLCVVLPSMIRLMLYLTEKLSTPVGHFILCSIR